MAIICKFPGCNLSFVPNRKWQKACCEDHARKLRYLRRKDKQAKLLEASRAEVAVLEIISDSRINR